MIPEGLIPRNEWGDVTIIGGNFVSWYGGFDSYIVAREIGDPITAPSMGRKQEQEDAIEDIHYMPYYTWREWINVLSQFNIGIHLMRTHAAGTFAMNCGFHGIPCIGYRGLDTQQIIHPNTTIEIGDLEGAKEIGLKLKNDDGFYSECSKEALYRFSEYYTEEKWLENWEKQWIK
jgi:glycosyltransferase involved in cell wall biosynthesis